MQQCKKINDIRAFSREQRAAGKTIGFVPTLGALHAGHASLIEKSVDECDCTIVSIFLNPAQFDRQDDLKQYPKTLKDDVALCEKLGVDAVFLPTEKEMYPGGGSMLMLAVAHFTDRLCGMSRPGHFRGVLLVVAKLFNIVEPDKAYFGEKDYQQLAIIRQLVHDLDFGLDIVACPLVREEDGLALSSRNKNLSPAERESALALSRTLLDMSQRVRSAEEADEELTLTEVLAEFAEELVSDPNIELDYFSAVDINTLEDVTELRKGTVFAIAAWVGKTRLIDNWIYR